MRSYPRSGLSIEHPVAGCSLVTLQTLVSRDTIRSKKHVLIKYNARLAKTRLNLSRPDATYNGAMCVPRDTFAGSGLNAMLCHGDVYLRVQSKNQNNRRGCVVTR